MRWTLVERRHLCMALVLQTIPNMFGLDKLPQARRTTTIAVSQSVALLHILQVVQVQSDLQYMLKQEELRVLPP